MLTDKDSKYARMFITFYYLTQSHDLLDQDYIYIADRKLDDNLHCVESRIVNCNS